MNVPWTVQLQHYYLKSEDFKSKKKVFFLLFLSA